MAFHMPRPAELGSLELAELQVGLLELIKGRPSDLEDPYLSAVARSASLQVVQEVAAWWRAVSAERSAPLTVAVLQACGYYTETLATLIQAPDLSPFHTQLAADFWSSAAGHSHPLVAAVARFEQTLACLSDGTLLHDVTIEWPVDPYPVLAALLGRAPIPQLPPSPHLVRVGPGIARGFEVIPGPATAGGGDAGGADGGGAGGAGSGDAGGLMPADAG